jgi:deoxyribonuclease V
VRLAFAHPWHLSPRDAIALQRELAGRVTRRGVVPERAVRLIAGCDVAFDAARRLALAAIVVLAYPSLEGGRARDRRVARRLPVRARSALVPRGARAAPASSNCARTDLLMVDGHGYAHPRRLGLACHLGLLLDLPAIGVAKSRLVGEHGPLGTERGARAGLVDDGEVIGSLLRTREGVKPLYVSVGHRISLAAAERWVLRCARGYRLPEPTRRADALSRAAKA